MPTTTTLPVIESTESPADVTAAAEFIRSSAAEKTALYPLGGGTSLDFGLPGKRLGVGLDLGQLNQIVDYPAADMTITVQAGIRMAELNELLAEHGQQLPLDVPHAADATLGGVLATDFSGPRRLGYGTARDYVIGIRAIDGNGQPFAGGGRVVKNVAGYDFCKLLIGSLGTLGVITEVTLKLKPLASDTAMVIVAPHDQSQLETILSGLVTSQTQPVAADWICGTEWQTLASDCGWPDSAIGWLLLMFEGTAVETSWSVDQIEREVRGLAGIKIDRVTTGNHSRILEQLSEFPARESAPIVIKATVLPSRVTEFVALAQRHATSSMQCHAANGIVRMVLPAAPSSGTANLITQHLQPAAAVDSGEVIMLRNRDGEMTPRAIWGSLSGPMELMQRIKRQFDPHDILNPGRFVY